MVPGSQVGRARSFISASRIRRHALPALRKRKLNWEMVWSECKGEKLRVWRWEAGKVAELAAWNPDLIAESR